jgi:hypothetical protein
MSDIWKRRYEIDRARSLKMEELMAEYDNTVHYPAKKQLLRDCFLEGHSGGKFHDNGFGWSWFYCGKCGGRYNIERSDGKTSPDDGASE